MIYRLDISPLGRRAKLADFKEYFMPIDAKEMLTGEIIHIPTFEEFVALTENNVVLRVEITKKSVIFDREYEYLTLIKCLEDGRGFFVYNKPLPGDSIQLWHPLNPDSYFTVSGNFFKELVANGLPLLESDKTASAKALKYGLKATVCEGVLLRLEYDDDSSKSVLLSDLCSYISECCIIRGRQVPGRYICLDLDDATLAKAKVHHRAYFRQGYYLTVDSCSSEAVVDFVVSRLRNTQCLFTDDGVLHNFDDHYDNYIEGKFRWYFDIGLLCSCGRVKVTSGIVKLYTTLSEELRIKYSELLLSPYQLGFKGVMASDKTAGVRRLHNTFIQKLQKTLDSSFYERHAEVLGCDFDFDVFVKDDHHRKMVILMLEDLLTYNLMSGLRYIRYILSLVYLFWLEYENFNEVLPKYRESTRVHLKLLFDALRR